MVILFDKASGDYVFHFPEGLSDKPEDGLYVFAGNALKRTLKPKSEYVFVQADSSSVLALVAGLREGKPPAFDLLQYANETISTKPEAAALQAASMKRAAVRAAKQAMKASKKLDGFENMTQKDWNDLTAAQRWDMVFAFMKTHLSED